MFLTLRSHLYEAIMVHMGGVLTIFISGEEQASYRTRHRVLPHRDAIVESILLQDATTPFSSRRGRTERIQIPNRRLADDERMSLARRQLRCVDWENH